MQSSGERFDPALRRRHFFGGSQQFVNSHRLSLSDNAKSSERARYKSSAELGEGGVGNEDVGAELLVHAFQPRGEIHRVADHRVIETKPEPRFPAKPGPV